MYIHEMFGIQSFFSSQTLVSNNEKYVVSPWNLFRTTNEDGRNINNVNAMITTLDNLKYKL